MANTGNTVVRGQRSNVNTTLLAPNVMPDVILTDGDLTAAMYLTIMGLYSSKGSTPNAKMQWTLDSYTKFSVTLTAGATATSDTLFISDPNAVIVNELWYNKTTQEMVFITANDGSASVKVIRGMGAKGASGPAAQAMSSGDTLLRLGPAVNPEKSKAQTTRTTSLETVTNYTQPFRWELEMGRRQRKSSFLTGKDWPYQYDKVFKEAKLDLARTMLFGQKSVRTDANGVEHTTTEGIFRVPTTNTYGANGTLYQTAFNEWLAEEALRFGSDKWMVASMDVILAINEMAESKIQIHHHMIDEKQKLGFEVMKYQAPNGKMLKIVHDQNITDYRNGDAVIVDMDSLEYKHFDGDGINDDLHIESSNAEDPDATNSHMYLYGDIGQTWKDEKTMALLTNVTNGGAPGRPVS